MHVLAFEADPLFRHMLPWGRARWTRWFFMRALNEAFAELGATPLPPGLPPWRLVRDGLHVERRIHALHPDEAHLYIYVLGVHPAQHGRGLGGALLRHAGALADAAGVPSHLETANPVNLGLYRHFGFEVKTEVTSHGGPPLWTMTRPKPPALPKTPA